MLQVEKIFKTYEGKSLLRGVSFSVGQNETVCLLGPSGSGKSTLLLMIAGLEAPDGGRILWDRVDLGPVPAHLRDFGLVFQDYALFPHLDVFDNIAYGLKMRHWSREAIQARLSEVLQLVNLTGFEHRTVTDLSGGEQQRVALARALAPKPRLLMFDEPLGALDRGLRESLLAQLRRILQETRLPSIYVTHDQDEASAIADRVLLLHEGVRESRGPPPRHWPAGVRNPRGFCGRRRSPARPRRSAPRCGFPAFRGPRRSGARRTCRGRLTRARRPPRSKGPGRP